MAEKERISIALNKLIWLMDTMKRLVYAEEELKEQKVRDVQSELIKIAMDLLPTESVADMASISDQNSKTIQNLLNKQSMPQLVYPLSKPYPDWISTSTIPLSNQN